MNNIGFYNNLYKKRKKNVILFLMKELLKNIREASDLSQSELAAQLGVSFATLNRWENGHSLPNPLAQERIFDFCREKGLPLYELVLEKAKKMKEGRDSGSKILLYHGSKSGIVGDIAPVSRSRCDFGRGFYMGDDPAQALTLISSFPEAELYLLSLDLDGLQAKEIPLGIDWALVVAYCRGKLENIKGSELYSRYSSFFEGMDLAIGSIANDRMYYVLDNFFEGFIADKALLDSLSSLDLGKQYVALTPKACSQLRIEGHYKLSLLERRCLQEKAESNRRKGIDAANEICKKDRRQGLFFDELLAKMKDGGQLR